jgi:1,4-alpha-glucan branching enzyme
MEKGRDVIHHEAERGGDQVRVTFSIPDDGPNGQAVAVVGDFNGWDPTATPTRRKGNRREATITMQVGRRYAFRYLCKDGTWFNDGGADAYELNEFGSYDSVLDLARPTHTC